MPLYGCLGGCLVYQVELPDGGTTYGVGGFCGGRFAGDPGGGSLYPLEVENGRYVELQGFVSAKP